MDLIVVILVVLAAIVMIFKKIDGFVYYICLVDIFLRILDFIANNLPVSFISNFINTYFPDNFDSIIRSYTSGIFTVVLIWLLLIVYIIFDYYLVRAFWKK